MLKHFQEMKSFYYTYHHLNVSAEYICENGISLFLWIKSQKVRYRAKKLRKEHEELLKSSNFTRLFSSSEDIDLTYAEQYYHIYHNLAVLINYVCEDEYHLGA